MIVHKENTTSAQTGTSMSTRDKFAAIIVRNPGIHLQEDEFCLLKTNAAIGKKHTKTTRIKTRGLRFHLPLFKHLGYHSANTKVKKETQEHWEKIPCRFFITTDRFIALSDKGGFNISADKVLDIKLHRDGMKLFVGSQTHFVFLSRDDIQRFSDLWQLIGQMKAEGIDPQEFIH